MAIPKEALDLIISFEGWVRRLPDDRAAPYLCPAHVPTIGYGTTKYEDGRRVSLADPPITRERGAELLAWEVRSAEAAVDRLCPGLPPLARGALVSFVYNCGAGALQVSSLRRVVNAKRYSEVPRELAKWRMGGGRILPGLVRRRRAEADLFLKGVRQRLAPLGLDETLQTMGPRVADPAWTAVVTG